MSLQSTIRQKHAEGMSVSEIAREIPCDRKTVYRYISQDDFSPKIPLSTSRPSMLEPYRALICSWLEEDRQGFSKQKHTNERIRQRLKDEADFECKYSTVSDFIRKNKLRGDVKTRASLDLTWEAGYAQADFGQADCTVLGEVVRMHYLVLSFPYSNMGYAQVFFGETAECACEGLASIFTHIGGVPKVIVFDNATGIGRRVHGEFIEGDLFSRLKAHYRFEARFCNPAAGWEKGNVERKVALIRNTLFVPAPAIDDIITYNKELLFRCAFQEEKIHYQKRTRQGELFNRDAASFISLPAKPFIATRFETVKANGYGHVVVDKEHTYSSVPEAAHRELIVGIGAHSVSIYDKAGNKLAVHPRSFGTGHTQTIDCLSQLRLLTRRPGGFKNSKIRAQIPKAVVSHLDAQDAEGLRRDLRLLYETCERSGVEATFDALDVLAGEHERFPDFFQVGVLAARIADMGLDVPVISGADLGIYDEMFLHGDTHE